MAEKDLSALTDEELLQEAKKLKSRSQLNALLIGIMMGIVLYSAVKNTWGMLTLIPLYFIFKLSKSETNKDELETLLKQRNLK